MNILSRIHCLFVCLLLGSVTASKAGDEYANKIADYRDEGQSAKRPPCLGMPAWWVTEPYINLWVADEPLFYNTTRGIFSFRISHKQRDNCDTLPGSGVLRYQLVANGELNAKYVSNHGMNDAKWHYEWSSSIIFLNPDHITVPYCWFQANYSKWQAYVHMPDGGVRVHDNFSAMQQELRTRERLVPLSGGSAPTYPSSGYVTNPNNEYWPDDSTHGYALIRPDGSRLIYNFVPNAPELPYSGGNLPNPGENRTQLEAMLTKRIAPDGATTKYVYEQPYFPQQGAFGYFRVKYIIDCDGRTNRLIYPNPATLVAIDRRNYWPTEIQSPYGATALLSYGGGDRLQSITDAAGLVSTFGYFDDALAFPGNPNSATNSGWLRYMDTPYGRTHFHYYIAPTNPVTGNLGGQGPNGDGRINRMLVVSHPDSNREMFLCRYGAPEAVIPESFAPGSVPTTPTWVKTANGGNELIDNGAATSSGVRPGLRYRNSFHWGRRQYNSIPEEERPIVFITPQSPYGGFIEDPAVPNDTVLSSPSSYAIARWRHWLSANDESADSTEMSDVLSVEREPSPNATGVGRTRWFGYVNKVQPHRTGAKQVVNYVAELLDNGSTRFEYTERNEYGLPTKVISSISASGGTTATRTNQFLYFDNQTISTNGYQLAKLVGPNGNNDVRAQFAYSSYNSTAGNPLLPNFPLMTEWIDGFDRTNKLAYLPAPYNQLFSLTSHAGENVMLDFYPWLDSPPHITVDPQNAGFVKLVTNAVTTDNLRFTWTNGQVATVTDSRGLTVTNFWDGLQRLTGVAFPDGTTISNVYSRLDLVRSKDRLDYWTTNVYNAMGEVTNSINALNQSNWWSYCLCGAVLNFTNAVTNFTHYRYDLQNQITNVSVGTNHSVDLKYDTTGQLTNVTDGAGRSVAYLYNNQGLLSAVSNAFGIVWGATYDRDDRVASLTNAYGLSVSNQYDVLGRITNRIWTDLTTGQSSAEQYGYGTNGLQFVTNRLGQVTRLEFNKAGRLLSVTNANLEVTRFQYHPSGDLLTLVDALNRTTTWQRDEYGRVTNKVDTLNNSVFKLAYDAMGRMTNRWTPAKGYVTNTYDAVGQLTRTDYPNNRNVQFAYDAANQLTNFTEVNPPVFAGSRVTAFTYTDAGQLRSESGPWEDSAVTRQYSQGLLSALIVKWSVGDFYPPRTNTHTYDSAGRLQSISSLADNFGYSAGNFEYSYKGATRLVERLTRSGSVTTNHYDAEGRLLETVLRTTGGALLDRHAYIYNPLGQRTNETRWTDSYRRYTYDAAGQLKTALGYEGNNAARINEQFRYGYDAAGNLSARTNHNYRQTFATDGLNQLNTVTRSGKLTFAGSVVPGAVSGVTVNSRPAGVQGDGTFAWHGFDLYDGTNHFVTIATGTGGQKATNVLSVALPVTRTFLHDANGNLTNDGRFSYTYDEDDRLTGVSERAGQPGGWKVRWDYDALGRRIAELYGAWNASGVYQDLNLVEYTHAGRRSVREVTHNASVFGGIAEKALNVWGPDLSGEWEGAGGIGGLLSRFSYNNPYHFHSDGGGNISTLVDGSGAVVGRYLYDPFGNTLGASGPQAGANRYRFSSKEVHQLSGLYHYGFRDYAPELQRWMSRDPIGEAGGINLYGFVGNDPVDFVDPHGLDYHSDSGGGFLRPAGGFSYLSGDSAFENLVAGAFNLLPLLNNTIGKVGEGLGIFAQGGGKAVTHVSGDPKLGEGVENLLNLGPLILTRGQSACRVATVSPVPQVLQNQAQGALGEAAVRARLLSSSRLELVGEQIRVTTPGVGSFRMTDFMVRSRRTGRLSIIEIKTGGATRDATQLAKDALIADPLSPTTFTGSRAAAARFPSGTPTGPIRTFEVNASNLKR